MSINLNKVEKILNNQKDIKLNDIKQITKIENSFTNEIYHLKMNDGSEYKLRIANENKFINRVLEKFIEMQLYGKDILYYDIDGNVIRKWIIGDVLELEDFSNEILVKIMNQVDKLHNIKVDKDIIVNKAKFYDDIVVENSINEAIECYKKITDNFNIDEFVLSHNDCSCNNIILDSNNNAYLIDFEWATYNHKLWDISNLIKDLELNFEDLNKYDFYKYANINELIKVVFATNCYTYYWTTRMELTDKILEYQKYIITRVLYWYDIIKQYGK